MSRPNLSDLSEPVLEEAQDDMTASIEEFSEAIRRERRDARAMAKVFASACREGDLEVFEYSVEALGSLVIGGWPLAMNAVSQLDKVGPGICAAFLCAWIQNKSIARHFDDIKALMTVLWKLMPPYTGGAVLLYRGESASARRRRAYGISWTKSLQVAEKFATDTRQCGEGGSCIVTALVPAAAIIGTMSEVGDFYNEQEYLVDRRRIGRVKLVRRFPQITAECYRLQLTQQAKQIDDKMAAGPNE